MNNSEILFIYDAKKCNPNGDMDNEDKPRMDLDTSTNLVSDVRLKRYIRDYLNKFKKLPIFSRKLGAEALNHKQSLALYKLLKEGSKEEEITLEEIKKVKDAELSKLGDSVFDLIDVRLFGATIPIQVEKGKGDSQNYTGPVQFNWGYSLNKVDLQESNTITSNISTSDSSQGAGVGKDYRVNYSLLAFNGSINSLNAEKTKLKDEDVSLLDEAVIKSIPLNRTRSKIGQAPRLYLRVEMSDGASFLNDLREYLDITESKGDLRGIEDVEVNISNLVEYLNSNKEKISKIFVWKDSNTKIKGIEEIESNFELEKLNY